MVPVPPLHNGAAPRLPLSVPSIVAAAVLAALGIVVATLAVRELLQPNPGDEVLLEVPTAPLAVFAAASMLVRQQVVRLVLVAGAIGALAAAGVYVTPVSIGFMYNSAYVLPAALGWMILILMVAGFVAAWRESGIAPKWALLAAVGGGIAGIFAAGCIFYMVLVIALIIHPLTF
jgi:hypothetical protein